MTHDPTCHEEHDTLAKAIRGVAEELKAHDEYAHSSLLTREQIISRDQAIADKLDELADAVIGPERTVLQGGGREASRGLLHRQARVEQKVDGLVNWSDTIDARLKNGGLKARLATSDRILVAIIGAVAVVASALIG